VANPLHSSPLGPVGPAGAPQQPTHLRPVGPSTGPAFREVFGTQLAQAGDVRFSGHALERLQRRGIVVDNTTLARLNDGVARAASKGARESLVLVDGTAFVVSVTNRTVITAVDREHMREHVFTNIDSAVIA
jgi:flagellar operon protein